MRQKRRANNHSNTIIFREDLSNVSWFSTDNWRLDNSQLVDDVWLERADLNARLV